MLRISREEYGHRLSALEALVRERGLDVFLVSSFDSIYYLTGAGFEPLERPFFLLVLPDRSPKLLVPKLDHEHMKKAYNIREEDIETYWEYPAPEGRRWPDRLRELIGSSTGVGVEPSLRQECIQELQEFGIHVVPLVEQQRILKSNTEVEMIRRAARYADFGVECLLSASYFNATVAEGFAQTRTVTARIIRELDDWEPSTTNVLMATWAAPRSAQPHSIPDLNDRLGDGPHVALVLTRVNGYAAESERTYFTAPPSPEAKEMFKAMSEARRVAFDMIRPGVSCSDLDSSVNEFLRKEGYHGDDQRLHRTGHGLGLGNHEAPWIAEGSEDQLAENMVISVEPGIYLKGLGGIRHSDTVLVTNNGYELLTGTATDIDSMTIGGLKPLSRMRGWLVRRALALRRKAKLSA